MYFFFALCALHFMQNFVTLVDPRPGLLFASKVQRVANVADDASVLEMEFGREIKRSHHAAETPSWARGSGHFGRNASGLHRPLRRPGRFCGFSLELFLDRALRVDLSRSRRRAVALSSSDML